MTTTLIVRDAILAINGAPEKKGEPREHLLSRVAEVARMDSRTAQECVEVLSSVARSEGVDPEVLEALVIVALSKPEVARGMKLDTLAMGRRLVSQLERAAEHGHTLAILELLCQHFPDNDALERELAQILRRKGTVEDLVSRYFERAKKLAREGRISEAAGWLREVLQLDPSCRDAARMLRDLRFKRDKTSRKKRGWPSVLFAVALLALGGSYVGLREVRLRQEFRALPAPVSGNTASLRRRLAELDDFATRNPVWHGALQLLAERSTLRVQLMVLEERERAARLEAERAARERMEAADLLRARGLAEAQSGDLVAALASFREALEQGGAEWVHHDRVAKDVSDLEANLAEQP